MRFGILFVAAGALALSGCINISRRPDPLLGHVAQTVARECPADRRQIPPRSGAGDLERLGVTEYEFSRMPLSGERGTMRMRRLDIVPGGVIAWHEHTTRQGMTILLAGELNEYRDDCQEPITHRVGEIIREDAATAHYWRNESANTAVLLVTDVLP